MKEKQKYKVIDKSILGHCCHKYSVLNERYFTEKDERGFAEMEKFIMCECLSLENALSICNSLNSYDPN